MTQPDQSELEQKLNELSELNKLGGRGHGDLADTCYICGISPSKLLAYITANYTPINQPSTKITPVTDGVGGSESTNQSEHKEVK